MLVSGQRQLDRDGFLVLDGLLSPESLRRVRLCVEELFQREGDSAGSEFKHEPGCRRLANLVNKGEVFERIIAHPDVLLHVGHVLGDFKLSSLNVRSVNGNCLIRQPLHADMAALPDERGPWVCNVLWMLSDITAENGATRVIPGTHRSGKLPQQVLDDPVARHPDEILLTGTAGTVIIINAHLWHGGTENRTPTPRTAVTM